MAGSCHGCRGVAGRRSGDNVAVGRARELCFKLPTMPAPIPILSSVAELADTSDAWIVDIWGVMHNGARAHPAAVDACIAFRRRGGGVVLLSNAPRPFAAVVPHMTALGVPPEAYDAGVTSGDATRDMISAWQGRPLLHIGPERDLGLIAGLDISLAPPAAAEVVLCSGLHDDTRETPANYADLWPGLVRRGVPMICANPDIMVERGHELIYCAGALAADYEAAGGKVTYAGKPHLPIYARTEAEIARLRGRPVARERVLCIGDGIDTDLKGAYAAGLRSVFIASPIFVPNGLDAAVLKKLFADRPFAPAAAMVALAW
jgi:HAD superfamily hydrolase (TIGR01459 family)